MSADELENYDQEALSAQLAEVRGNLDNLGQELGAVDSELERFGTDRQRYQLLQEVCGGLEKLRELGGENLFWEGARPDGRGDDHVYVVRRRVDEFNRQIADIESARQAILDRTRTEEESAEYIEDDLFELERLEEERKLEWVPEREASELPERATVMPWTRGGEDDWRFRKSLATALLLSLLFGFLFPLIDLPLPDPWKPVEIPERLTRLIKQELPPPPPAPKELQPKETKPEEQLVAEERPVKPEPKPEPQAPQKLQEKTSETKGILAFREKFSGLAENKATARLGAQAKISRSGDKPGQRTQRSMVTTQGAGSSGGINLASISREVGGGGGRIEGVEVTQATSAIGEMAGEERPLSGGPGPARTDEEIQIVFDRHKAALYRLYNRELRRDPTLKGQIVLRIKIEPDGSVSLCEVQSSDMKAPKLAAQVVGRVKKFDFGAKEGVSQVEILYPIDFLPAT